MIPVVRMMIQIVFAQVDPSEEIVVVREEQRFTGQPQSEDKEDQFIAEVSVVKLTEGIQKHP